MGIISDTLKRRNILSEYYEEHPDIYQQIRNHMLAGTFTGAAVGTAVSAGLGKNPALGALLGASTAFPIALVDRIAKEQEILNDMGNEEYTTFKLKTYGN